MLVPISCDPSLPHVKDWQPHPCSLQGSVVFFLHPWLFLLHLCVYCLLLFISEGLFCSILDPQLFILYSPLRWSHLLYVNDQLFAHDSQIRISSLGLSSDPQIHTFNLLNISTSMSPNHLKPSMSKVKLVALLPKPTSLPVAVSECHHRPTWSRLPLFPSVITFIPPTRGFNGLTDAEPSFLPFHHGHRAGPDYHHLSLDQESWLVSSWVPLLSFNSFSLLPPMDLAWFLCL